MFHHVCKFVSTNDDNATGSRKKNQDTLTHCRMIQIKLHVMKVVDGFQITALCMKKGDSIPRYIQENESIHRILFELRICNCIGVNGSYLI